MQKESFLICNDACTWRLIKFLRYFIDYVFFCLLRHFDFHLVIQSVFEQGSKHAHLLTTPPQYWLSTYFLNFVSTPLPHPISRHLDLVFLKLYPNILLQFVWNLFITIWWRLLTSGGFMYKARLSQVMVNRITRSMLMFL